MPRKRKAARSENEKLGQKLRDDARRRRSLEMLSKEGFSHTLSEHVDVDDIYVIDRLLSEHIRGGAMSRYPSKERANAIVSAIVERFAGDISSIRPRSGKRTYAATLADLGMRGIKLHGIVRDPFSGRIDEVVTDCVRLVVAGNTHKGSPYGITDISSYPCMLPDDDVVPHLERTSRKLLPELRRTAFYATAEPLLKAYLEQCCDKQHNTRSEWLPAEHTLVVEMHGTHMPKQTTVTLLMRQDDMQVHSTLRVETVRTVSSNAPKRTVSEKRIVSASDWASLEKRFPQDGKCARKITRRAYELIKDAPKPFVSASDILPSV